jgi:1-acyl-sn-glycerol-3-phosphate acyltransferase
MTRDDDHHGVRGSLRAAVRGSRLAAWTASVTAASDVHERLVGGHQRQRVIDRNIRRWARGMLRGLGVELNIAGAPAGPDRRATLVVANHRTALDIPVMLSVFGGHFLSRADIADWPVLGAGAKKAGSVFVDREDHVSGAAAIRKLRGLLASGRTVTVFPEGTTHAGDEVRPFNAGAFVAAKGLDVVVRPVGLAYPPGCEFTQEAFLDHARDLAARRSMRVGVVVGPPMPLPRDRKQAVASTHEAVGRLVRRARQLIDSP